MYADALEKRGSYVSDDRKWRDEDGIIAQSGEQSLKKRVRPSSNPPFVALNRGRKLRKVGEASDERKSR